MATTAVAKPYKNAPPCTFGGDHDWREDGVWSSGGGVRMRFRCAHCGWQEKSDSWNHRDDKPLKKRRVWFEAPERA